MNENDEPRAPELPGFLPDGRHVLIDFVPHAGEVGMALVRKAKGEAWMSLPYDDRFVGDPDSGVIHGGLLTTLLDNCCGVAVFLDLEEMLAVATLDLRINYMRPATPGRDVTAHAVCYRRTRSVAFTRAVAFHDDPETPIATASGAFMLSANDSFKRSLEIARQAGVTGAR